MNRVAVVTGAASGIGLAVARKYLQMNVCVVGIDKNELVSEFELKVCDICDEESVKTAFEDIVVEHGKIDYLINSAGVFFVGKRSPVMEMDICGWNAVIQNNLTGTMLCCKYAVPMMENKGERDCGIVNITSDQAFFPRKENAAYAVSKSGINSLTKLLAQELLSQKIRVNAIAPASVRSHFIDDLATTNRSVDDMYESENNKMPFGLIMPEDVAELACFLGSVAARKITGQIILMDSGLYERRV